MSALIVFVVVSAGSTFAATIVNGLGTLTPSSTLSIFGTGGQAIGAAQTVGPGFTLATQTLITEIGGFLNNCTSVIGGVPMCPNVLPFLVDILPAKNGVPDVTAVPRVFSLPVDTDPLTVSYESVNPMLVLPAGSYFALFAAQANDGGFLLQTAPAYQAGPALLGFTGSGSSTSSQSFAAIQILGSPVPEPASPALFFLGLVTFALLKVFVKVPRQEARL